MNFEQVSLPPLHCPGKIGSMTISQNYTLMPNDWVGLEIIINDLSSRTLAQFLTIGSSPTFAGLTITGLSGVLKATTGVISGSATFDDVTNGSSTTMRTNLNADLLDGLHAVAFQSANVNLTSLSGLTFVSTSFVKMTATGTFGLDTNTYLTSFTESDPLSLHLDQTTPQTIINGIPLFNLGLKIVGNTKFNLLQGSGSQSVDLTYTLPSAYPASIAFLKVSNAGTISTDTATYLTAESDPIAMGYIDQSVKVAASPQFANLILTSGGTIKPSANSTTAVNIAQADGTAFIKFDTTNKRMGINVTPTSALEIKSSVTANANILKATVAGDANSYFSFRNNTGSASVFIPTFYGYQHQMGSGYASLNFVGLINPDLDVAPYLPVGILFDCYTTDENAVNCAIPYKFQAYPSTCFYIDNQLNNYSMYLPNENQKLVINGSLSLYNDGTDSFIYDSSEGILKIHTIGSGINIGIADTQKLGFYGKTPVDQPNTIADPTGGLVADAEARTAINILIDRLQELGLIA
jgi:hypothetical protein